VQKKTFRSSGEHSENEADEVSIPIKLLSSIKKKEPLNQMLA
jgi:hypothetical protein